MNNVRDLESVAKLIRYYALFMSTKAGSGHPTTSLSATDLMTALFATTYRYDFNNPEDPNNDRLIFSKGHASPLYYALFAASGVLTEKDLEKYRQFNSVLEGHPTPRFRYTEAAAGSLGQGLSIGVGMAIAIKSEKLKVKSEKLPRVFVLLGDGEMAEGSVWEAMEIASHYKLRNLVGIIDVNRLGQSEETMLGYDVETYRKRVRAFGWETEIIDGHNFTEILAAYKRIGETRGKPYMIIAKTIKGKGVSFLENKNGWHGKALSQEDFERAVKELGEIDYSLRLTVGRPAKTQVKSEKLKVKSQVKSLKLEYKLGDLIATRKAYGEALAQLGEVYPEIVALDGDVKNSTFSEIFKARFPGRFYEMYIAEQNMVGAAIGMSKMGYIPFASTFAAFFTRTYDQVRMGAISRANIKLVGSHAGVSIGEDGPSQMGLEDLSMFRAVQGSTVLYPSDAVSTLRLVEDMVNFPGIVYMRTSRPATAVIYGEGERFEIGGSKVHRVKSEKLKVKSRVKSSKLSALIIGAGVTLHESLKAQQMLAEKGINTVVIDCYSIKPIDEKTINKYGDEAGLIITVEDHWFEGGLGDAVLNIFSSDLKKPKIIKLAVKEMPRSGKPAELMAWAGIDAAAIASTVRKNIRLPS